MTKFNLNNALEDYRSSFPEETELVSRFEELLNSDEKAFSRENLKRHITGSCLVVNPERNKTLLTHHRKLKKWIQLGGHSDGNPNTLEVAIREAQEESGIEQISPLTTRIISMDIHSIPARPNEPEHDHYDITFLLQAGNEDYKVSEESIDLNWVELKKAPSMKLESSVQKMLARARLIIDAAETLHQQK